MASKKAEIKALITLAGKIDPSLQSAMLKAQGETAKVTKEVSKLGTVTKGVFLGNLLTKAVTKTANFMRRAGSEAIQLASDLVEVQNVVDVIFDKDAEQINKWAKQATAAFGMTELQAKQYSGTLGAIMESAGISTKILPQMSMRLAGIAGDLASFYNLDYDKAFEKVQAGLAGQVLPLRQLGINMTVANLEAYALSKGIKQSWSQMDQATQTMIRYSYIVAKTHKAQGDFARTQGSYANQLKLVKTNWQSLLAELSTKPLTGLAEALAKVNKLITGIDIEKVADSVAWAFNLLADSIGFVVDNSNWLIPALAGVAGGMAALKVVNTVTGLMNLYKASTFATTLAQHGLNAALMANPIGLAVVGFGALVAVGVALWRNWDRLVDKAKKLWGWVTKLTEPVRKFFGFGGGGGRPAPTAGTISTDSMDAFSRGGIATRPSIFGEDGPEIAIPLQRTSRSLALLNQASQILLGTGLLGKGSTTAMPAQEPRSRSLLNQASQLLETTNNTVSIAVHNHVYADGNDAQELAKATGEATEDAVERIIERYGLSKARVSYGY